MSVQVAERRLRRKLAEPFVDRNLVLFDVVDLGGVSVLEGVFRRFLLRRRLLRAGAAAFLSLLRFLAVDLHRCTASTSE